MTWDVLNMIGTLAFAVSGAIVAMEEDFDIFIQGALMAVYSGASLAGAIVAATLTGAGGGMIRDVFAGRKPMIFRDEIYALWAALGGLLIGIGLVKGAWLTGVLLAAIVLLRMLSVHYRWHLPRRSLT